MGVNLLEKLSEIRAKNAQPSNNDIIKGFKVLLNQPNEGERILRNLFKSKVAKNNWTLMLWMHVASITLKISKRCALITV